MQTLGDECRSFLHIHQDAFAACSALVIPFSDGITQEHLPERD